MTGFTDEVRRELSHLDPAGGRADRAELAALLGLAGDVAAGAAPRLALRSRSGATVRRTYALLERRYGRRPQVSTRAPEGDRDRLVYLVALRRGAAAVVDDLQLGVAGLPRFVDDADTGIAFLRGAIIAAGSISAPGRPPHLEIAAGRRALARELAGGAGRWLEATVTATDDDRDRVVIKSGETIGELLGRLGATNAYLTWQERRLRREVRAEATRLANADAANVRRSIEAAAEQVEQVQRAVAAVGWEGLDEDVREVALARLANPSASLAELGELCDPPVGKSAVHRRLERLAAAGGG